MSQVSKIWTLLTLKPTITRKDSVKAKFKTSESNFSPKICSTTTKLTTLLKTCCVWWVGLLKFTSCFSLFLQTPKKMTSHCPKTQFLDSNPRPLLSIPHEELIANSWMNRNAWQKDNLSSHAKKSLWWYYHKIHT